MKSTLTDLQCAVNSTSGKFQLKYDHLKVIAKHIATSIKDQDIDLVAIARGGLTLGQLVAYYLAKPLYVYYPKIGAIYPPIQAINTPVFIEDVLATGRTLQGIREKIGSGTFIFAPAIIDAKYTDLRDVLQSINTSTWVVFPHEEFDLVQEGDHGLFREGTSANSKSVI